MERRDLDRERGTAKDSLSLYYLLGFLQKWKESKPKGTAESVRKWRERRER